MSVVQLVQEQQIIGLNQEALDDWVEYREEKKKPLSPLALKRTIKIMLRYPEDHQMHLVDVAISRDWQGLYDVEMPKTKPQVNGDTSWLDQT